MQVAAQLKLAHSRAETDHGLWIFDGAPTMSSHRLSKVAVAMGGFLILVGITMIGVFALVFSGIVDISVLRKEYQMLFLWVLLVIGVLDVVSGIILRRW